MEHVCGNCASPHPETFKFCPECGQKTTLHRLSFHDLWHEGVHYFTHADKNIFSLVKQLATQRGAVAREFIAGKRKTYFSPFNFFMIIAAVFVFAATLGQSKTLPNVRTLPQVQSIENPEAREKMAGVLERKEKVVRFTDQYSNLMAMMSLPLTALVFWLFFKRAGFNYVEHVVAGMYMLGFCILIYALLILPIFYLLHAPRDGAVLVFFLVQIVYFSIFYNGFLQHKTRGKQLLSGLASTVNLVVWVLLSGNLVRWYISDGMGGLLH